MDVNQIRRLAGLPEQALVITTPIVEQKLPEATIIREEEQLNEGMKNDCSRITGELVAALVKKSNLKPSPELTKICRDSINDAYEAGYDAGEAEAK